MGGLYILNVKINPFQRDVKLVKMVPGGVYMLVINAILIVFIALKVLHKISYNVMIAMK